MTVLIAMQVCAYVVSLVPHLLLFDRKGKTLSDMVNYNSYSYM